MSLFFHRSTTTTTKSKNHAIMHHGCCIDHRLPVDVDAPPTSKSSSSSIPRIPIALQKIFLQSNRGEVVHVPPPKNIASRIFRTLTFRKNNSNRKGTSGSSLSKDLTTLITPPSPDHTTTTNCSSSSNNSSNSSLDPTVIFEVNYNTVSTASNIKSPQHLTMKKELTLMVTPQSYVDAILQSRGYTTTKYYALQTSYYNLPTLYQQICYNTYILQLVKQPSQNTKDDSIHAHIQQMFMAGISSNPCNAHGESLLHTICRLGTGNSNHETITKSSYSKNATATTTTSSRSYQLLQLMISIGQCDISNCVDDYGRTPLHDACWCNTICYDTITFLIRKDPTLLLLQDCRGATPLSYIPQQHYITFIEYMTQYKDVFFPIIPKQQNSNVSPRRPVFPSPFVYGLPNSRPVPDPINALSPDVARMVVSGKITSQELSFLLCQGDDLEDDDNSNDDDDDDESESSYGDDYDEADEGDDSSTIFSTEDDHDLVNPLKGNELDRAKDDDDDEEESYSDLDEMLRKLHSPIHQSVTIAEDEAVLGICRPQYGYSASKFEKTNNNDRYHDHLETDSLLTNEDANTKPMSSVMIPTIHNNNNNNNNNNDHLPAVARQRSSAEAGVTHATPLNHHTNNNISSSKIMKTTITTNVTNELLEFSV